MSAAHVTVIGGGIGGLVAAITAAESGASVSLHEAHGVLGGRWRSNPAPRIAHEGPHVLYADGPLYGWLRERRLIGRDVRVPVRGLARMRFRMNGSATRVPPLALMKMLSDPRVQAPVDESFSAWAGRRYGEDAAARAASAVGVTMFTADPGRYSAAFVWQRLRRAFAFPPAARFRVGGWSGMLPAMGDHARTLGVRIELGSRVSEVPATGTTIVATELESAKRLLGEPGLAWPSGAVGLLDLGLRRSRRDAYIVVDLDESGWLEDFAVPDPSVAPQGESLVQLQLGLRDEESTADAVGRLERFADAGLPGWRERLTWRRDSAARGRTGALDLPGTTWRDRPSVHRGDGVYLVGDRVAAPGLLSEVSWASAVSAAHAAAGAGVISSRS